ncbi:MAG: hypothetical protein RLY16_3044 [Bacteroidota bacterium]|jgi:putative flippase GtrA
MPLQTFRYAACGGTNVVVGFVAFTVLFHGLGAQPVSFGGLVFESYSVALGISSAVVFAVGFLLNKFVVFTSSNLRGRIQLVRYFFSFSLNLALNYVLLKLLVKRLHVYPVVAQICVTAFVVLLSYFIQQHFTFKVKKLQSND